MELGWEKEKTRVLHSEPASTLNDATFAENQGLLSPFQRIDDHGPFFERYSHQSVSWKPQPRPQESPSGLACRIKGATDRSGVIDPTTPTTDEDSALSAPAVFVARNETQARDWALVLVSRGVTSTLGHDGVSGRWFLLIPAELRERGAAELRAYHRENRRWAWRAPLPDSDVQFHWGAMAWVLANVFAFQFGPEFAARGWFDPRRFAVGEWWRAVTAVWLHQDVAHLASNAIYGAIVLGLALGRYGIGIGLLGGLLGGTAGNLLCFWVRGIDRGSIGLGASGMVMAGVGLLAAQTTALWRHSRHATRFVVPSLFAGGFLFLFLGTDPKSDVLAHLGGFVAGVIYGTAAALLPDRVRIALNRPAAALFLILTLGSWILALR